MKNMLLGLVALFCLGTVTTLTSCNKDDGGCLVCTYERPDNNETVVTDPLCRDTDDELDEWEDIFRETVTSAGEEWVDVEITCEKE